MAPHKKRTYSKFDKKNAALAQDSYRKRVRGVEDDDELRLPDGPPHSRPQASFSSFTMKQKFQGPVSFSVDDDLEIDNISKKRNPLDGVFDKALTGKGKLNPIKREQPNIHGSREDFDNTMTDPKRTKKTNGGWTSRYLPTPPSDNEKQQGENVDRTLPESKQRSSSLVTKPAAPKYEPMKTSKLFENIIRHDAPKQSYVPKQYKSDGCPAPRRDICGDRLSSKSEIAKLWSENQTNSPFLRLPGEIRNRIYDHAFRGKTIKIDYETYRTTPLKDKPNMVTKVFKYNCTVHSKRRNPFSMLHPIGVDISTSFTLLNNICRQLYLETARLPFVENFIAFESYNVMVNFILHEKRLTSQQRSAISVLVLPDDIPGGNMLAYLPNLEKVYLAFTQYQKPMGYYKVIRKDGQEPYLEDSYGRVMMEL